MLGPTLRILRTTAGISLREMARKLALSPAYLSQVERGKLPPPTLERIHDIAGIIGVPVSFLQEMSERPDPELTAAFHRRPELAELVRSVQASGLRPGDIHDLSLIMRLMGDAGFREFLDSGLRRIQDFRPLRRSRAPTRTYLTIHDEQQRRMAEILDPRLIFPRLVFEEKEGLLRFLLEKTEQVYPALESGPLLHKLMEREAETSSGLGNAVAVPHLLVSGLSGTILAVGRLPSGINFDSLDRKPVHLVCLVLGDEQDIPSHIHLLAYLAARFQRARFVEDVHKARTRKQIISLFQDRASGETH